MGGRHVHVVQVKTEMIWNNRLGVPAVPSIIWKQRDLFHQFLQGPFSLRLPSLGDRRWLTTLSSITVCHLALERPELYMFRRMQLAEQAALKQARNPLQKCLIFHARAQTLQDRSTNIGGYVCILCFNRMGMKHLRCIAIMLSEGTRHHKTRFMAYLFFDLYYVWGNHDPMFFPLLY